MNRSGCRLAVLLLVAWGAIAGAEPPFFAHLDAVTAEVRAGKALTPAERDAMDGERRATWDALVSECGNPDPALWPAEVRISCYISDIQMGFLFPGGYNDEPQDPTESSSLFEPIQSRLATTSGAPDPYLLAAVLMPAIRAGDPRYAADTFALLEAADADLADAMMRRILEAIPQRGAIKDFLAMVAGYGDDRERVDRSGNVLEVVETDPPAPAVLGIGERLRVRIRYRATGTAHPRIWCQAPLDNDSPEIRYMTWEFAGEEAEPQGEVTRWLRFSAPMALRAVVVSMSGDEPNDTLLRMEHPLDVRWADRYSAIPTNQAFEAVRSVRLLEGVPAAEPIRDALIQSGVKRLVYEPPSSAPVWGVSIGNDVPVAAAQLVVKICLSRGGAPFAVQIQSGDREGVRTHDEDILIGLSRHVAAAPLSRERLEALLAPGLTMEAFCRLASAAAEPQM